MPQTITASALLSTIEECSAFLQNRLNADKMLVPVEACNQLCRDVDSLLEKAHMLGIVNRNRMIRHAAWDAPENCKFREEDDQIIMARRNTEFSIQTAQNIRFHFRNAVEHVMNSANAINNKSRGRHRKDNAYMKSDGPVNDGWQPAELAT